MLLEPYAREVLASGSVELRAGLAELLSLPDPLLAQYLLGEGLPAAADLAQHVSRIKALCRRGASGGVILPVGELGHPTC